MVILAAMDKFDTYAKTNRETAKLEQKQKNGIENANEKINGSKGKSKGQQKGNNDGKSREPNPCKTHNGQHDWRNCPNNPCSRSSRGTTTAYPDPAITFYVYPDASSKFAMGTVLVQDGKVILTFSRKCNNAQLMCMVTDQELLAVLEVCKHFKQIIHGCNIRVHTNHKNLTFNTAQSNARVERSLILLQEKFGVKLEHIPGEKNTAAGGLSRLAFDKNLVVN
jgi:hypothetical protein